MRFPNRTKNNEIITIEIYDTKIVKIPLNVDSRFTKKLKYKTLSKRAVKTHGKIDIK